MKKKLLLFILLLTTASLWAQHWTAPSEYDFPQSTIIYAQVKCNSISEEYVEVAAFVDGQCRADAMSPDTRIGNNDCYTLRVWGNDDEIGTKAITFKAFYNGVAYKFTKTVTFSGETYTPYPLVLNLDIVSEIVLPQPLVIEQKLPVSNLDLNQYAEYGYRSLDGSLITPIGESSIDMDETPFSTIWSINTGYDVTVTADGKLSSSVEIPENKDGAILSVEAKMNDNVLFSGYTTLYIHEPVILVEQFNMNKTLYEVYPGDDVYSMIRAEAVLGPDDATDKSLDITPTTVTFNPFPAGIATTPGTYTLNVAPVLGGQGVKPIIVTVKVLQPATSLAVSATTLDAYVGDNVYDIIKSMVTVAPADADYKSLICKTSSTNGEVDENGMAVKAGTFTVTVEAEKATNDCNTVTVAVTVRQPVTAITASKTFINVNVGDNVYDIVRANVFVTPTNATDSTLVIKCSDGQAFPNKVATEAEMGKEYTFTVSAVYASEECNSVQIGVYVLKPLVINVPATLELSKYTDTPLAITYEGDAFDESKVTVLANDDNCVKIEGSGLEWNISALYFSKNTTITVYYASKPVGQITYTVKAEQPLANGWNWITPVFVSGKAIEFFDYEGNRPAFMNNWIDIRSQYDLLYKDPEYGFFGNLFGMIPFQMYKLKTSAADTIRLTNDVLLGYEIYGCAPMAQRGYNWIGFPYEGSCGIDGISTTTVFQEGDMFIGKDAFAEYTDGKWHVSDGFMFESGNGYLFYSVNGGEEIAWNNPADNPAGGANAKVRKASKQRTSVFSCDASMYADNMAIVAEVTGVDESDDLTVGAFVDGECRGMGRFVDGKLMINVAGKAGEKVSFVLYDANTAVSTPLPQTLTYCQKAGSFKSPISLGSVLATGISNVNNPCCTASTKYNLNGQRISNGSKGVTLVNGKKYVK